jgi:hypothetical protein
MAQNRINIEEENRKLAQEKRTIASDSLQKFQLQVLELDNNNEIAGELGPLQYLSGLTGVSMDKIINWLLLIIIFVFDPLAISLVIAANFAFEKAYPKKKYKENLYGEYYEDKFSEWDNLEDIEVKDAEEIKTQDEFMANLDRIEEQKHWKSRQQEIKDWEEAERRMGIIGQNGNDGQHYDEIEKIKSKVKKLKNQLDTKGNDWKKRKTQKINKEISKAEKKIISKQDETKIY